MAVNPAGVRAFVERACARPDAPGARAGRDFGAVISALSAVGGPWTW
jgi:hypothetical protein